MIEKITDTFHVGRKTFLTMNEAQKFAFNQMKEKNKDTFTLKRTITYRFNNQTEKTNG